MKNHRMAKRYLNTSDLARHVGIHPNTVRLYEKWGLIPPVERSPSGYRRFTEFHLDCLLLARLIYSGGYPGKLIRQSGLHIAHTAASGDLGGALELAYQHKAIVQAEQAQAEAAAELLQRWAQGSAADSTPQALQIGQVAKLLHVSIDMLRNWERNGLLKPPRNPHNRYRLYGSAEIGRLRIIRMLSRAGYSMMAILRMMKQLDAGKAASLREALDSPRADEDVYSASDRWLSTLAEQQARAQQVIDHLESMIHKEVQT